MTHHRKIDELLVNSNDTCSLLPQLPFRVVSKPGFKDCTRKTTKQFRALTPPSPTYGKTFLGIVTTHISVPNVDALDHQRPRELVPCRTIHQVQLELRLGDNGEGVVSRCPDRRLEVQHGFALEASTCLLYTSDAADE